MKNLSNFLIKSKEILLTEAFNSAITLGELKEILRSEDTIIFEDEKSNTQITPDKKIIDVINKYKHQLLNLPLSDDDEYVFFFDVKKKKYRITPFLSNYIKESPIVLRSYDSNFFGIGTGEIKKGGANKGDIQEILFSVLCYLYIINKGQLNILKSETFSFIESLHPNDKNISVETKINNINIVLDIKLKFDDVLSYIMMEDSKEELNILIDSVITFITTNELSFLDSINTKLYGNEYTSSTVITIESHGNDNNKLDKSDVRIKVSSEEENNHSISIKDKITTFARIELTTLNSIKSGFDIFNFSGLTPELEIKLQKLIDAIKKKYTLKNAKKDDGVDTDALEDSGYKIALLIFNELIKEFKKQTTAQRLESFLIDPLFNFIKGTNREVHEKDFMVADILKNRFIKIKSKNHYTINDENVANKIGKKLILSKVFSNTRNRVNQLILSYDKVVIFKLRYSARNLINPRPRFQLYIEISNINSIEKILSELREQLEIGNSKE